GCIYASNQLLAQVNDAFDDGDFTNNPIWSGDDGLFVIESEALRSSSSGAAVYYLSTPSTLAANAEWQLFFNLKFSTSGANYVDIYLMADNADLSAVTDAMFVRIGGTDDKIALYKKVGGLDTEIITSPNSIVNSSSNNPFRVKVSRDLSDLWLLEYDDGDLGAFSTAGSVTDNAVNTSTDFGILITQSSAASPIGNHFFDDIVVQEIGFDETPPELTNLEVLASDKLKLIFSEEIDQTIAETLGNYDITGSSFPNLQSAELTLINEVTLTFVEPFPNGSYSIEISNIEDLKGNVIATVNQPFDIFFPDSPEFRDVIITEIMADPSPTVQLPDAEYLEIFNASDKIFDLNGWKLSDATTTVGLTSFVFEPGERVIICSNASKALFEPYGNVVGVSSLPSLNNSGDNISLKFIDDLLIDSLAYSDDWYGDEDKGQGGYALELIDINNTCGGANNWTASISETGGTPGEINSVDDPLAGAASPSIISISVLDDRHLSILMSEALDSTSLEASNFQVDQGVVISDVSLNYDTLFLSFESSIVPNTDYQLSIATISDCTGNAVGFSNETFQLFVNPEISYRDIIINEIMANPSEETTSPNVEFVELLNKSDKLINLKGWKFTDGSRTAVLPDYFLNPSEFVVLAPKSGEPLFDIELPVIGLSVFPTLNNSGDTLQLLTEAELKVDSLAYSSSWYQSTTKDDGGYSLELIDENNTCNISTNWIASVDNSGGTPGIENSVKDVDSGTSLPELIAVATNIKHELKLEFSEYIRPESIALNGFLIEPAIEVNAFSQEGNVLILQLSSDLVANWTYTITISGVEDCTGNVINQVSEEFLLFENPTVNYKDVVINEVMANPSIETAVANAEYIELYNNSGKTINLQNWKVTDKSRTASLPYYLFEPEEYVILTDVQNITEFGALQNIIGLAAFPTLNNGSDFLQLIDEKETSIDSIFYTSSWYRSSIKDDGGYSLELIDPDNFCAEDLNWIASEDETGGTPGRINSVFSQMPDNMGPQLQAAYGLSTDSVLLIFNEKLDEQSIYNANYSLSGDLVINEIISVDLKNIYILLSPQTSLESGRRYSVTIQNLSDCPGNIINDQLNGADFYLIEDAVEGDILVNEILFDPRPNGVDFVELYNNTNKFISIKDWAIANGDFESDSLVINTTRIITSENKVLGPNSYFVLTTDNIVLKDQYPKSSESTFLEIGSLPSFPNEEGLVAIVDAKGVVLDYFAYTEDLHADIINDAEGVSLERISFTESAQNDNNWMSAAASENFATPGYLNSQVRNINQALEGEITIEPKVIIPDGSGQRDFTTINYAFAQSGNVANVRVFDVQGREIKRIASNDFVSSSGFYTWDGSDNNGQKAKIGYYIVFFEVFNSSGDVNSFKERVVIGSQF
ncbi:lamin tail domain-containing protein, partial [Fulvivirga lutimaris]|uniref:lamin tail domain-containing protein n=1 Tax=Fulvivirga lutimaris TaxID=1819566 RepID=UPI0012BD3D2C